MKNFHRITTIGFWILLIWVCFSCNTPKLAPSTPDPISTSNDSIPNINALVAKQLLSLAAQDEVFAKNIRKATTGTFLLSDENLNQAAYLVGSLIDISGTSESPIIEIIEGYNFLKSPESLTTDLLDKEPILDTYLKQSVKTDVEAIKIAKASFDAESSYHVNYKTIYSCVPKGNFIDDEKLNEKLNDYLSNQNLLGKLDELRTRLKIIRTVTINRLSYQRFKELKAGIVGGTSIVNVNGSLFYGTGEARNYYEVIITTSKVLFNPKPEIKNDGPGKGLKEDWHPKIENETTQNTRPIKATAKKE